MPPFDPPENGPALRRSASASAFASWAAPPLPPECRHDPCAALWKWLSGHDTVDSPIGIARENGDHFLDEG